MLGVCLAAPLGLAAQSSSAQPPASTAFTLEQALQYAVDHYPTVRAALEQITASTAGVAVAKAAYLPRLDSLWQSNRGTANNIFGQVLPQSVIPAMSGPVLDTASGRALQVPFNLSRRGGGPRAPGLGRGMSLGGVSPAPRTFTGRPDRGRGACERMAG